MHMYNLTVAAVTIKALCACVSLILTHGIACVYIEVPKRFDGSITAIYTIIIIIMNDYFLLVNTIYTNIHIANVEAPLRCLYY